MITHRSEGATARSRSLPQHHQDSSAGYGRNALLSAASSCPLSRRSPGSCNDMIAVSVVSEAHWMSEAPSFLKSQSRRFAVSDLLV